tara:strand:- start:28153 stop:28410 length:258 start_codon:yes stop_codon:yes gene_type:complete
MPSIAKTLLQVLAYLFFCDWVQQSGVADAIGKEIAETALLVGSSALVVLSLLALVRIGAGLLVGSERRRSMANESMQTDDAASRS